MGDGAQTGLDKKKIGIRKNTADDARVPRAARASKSSAFWCRGSGPWTGTHSCGPEEAALETGDDGKAGLRRRDAVPDTTGHGRVRAVCDGTRLADPTIPPSTPPPGPVTAGPTA